MTFEGTVKWVEAHPTESIIIGGASVIALLWLLGAFGGTSKGDSGASNLASAYYAAEAQQAVVGGQIQQATIAAAASTAQKTLDDNAAVAINAAQTHAAIKINGQNADAAQTINGQNVAGATKISGDQLQATYSNNAAFIQTTQSNNAAAMAVNASNNQTSLLNNWISTIMPTEANLYGTAGFAADIAGMHFSTSGLGDPNTALKLGYTPAQVAKMFGPQ